MTYIAFNGACRRLPINLMIQIQKKWLVVGVLFFGFLILNPFFIIRAGERGVVLRVGKVSRVAGEGLGFRIPLVEKVKKLDVKIQKEEENSEASSKDLQTVSAVIALNYNLVPEEVGLLWQEVGKDYKFRIIDPAIQESVKAATARYTAEELITKREQVREDIKLILGEKLTPLHINVAEFSIVNFEFSKQFNASIEEKVKAEQDALKAQNDLKRVEFEAQQKVTAAKAEAEAIRIQAQAITQQGGRDYVQLQAVQKWNGILPINLYGSAPIPFLNIQ